MSRHERWGTAHSNLARSKLGGGGGGEEGSDDLPPAPHVSSPRNSRNAIFLPTNIWLTYTSVVIIA